MHPLCYGKGGSCIAAAPPCSPWPCTASQRHGVLVWATRCLRWAGNSTCMPCARCTVVPSGYSSVASPCSTITHSSQSWSYHSPGGVVCPWETMRSTSSPLGPCTMGSKSSWSALLSAGAGGGQWKRLCIRSSVRQEWGWCGGNCLCMASGSG